MGQKEKQKIEIEKLHRDPLPPLNQTVTADYSDFLGTALTANLFFLQENRFCTPDCVKIEPWHAGGRAKMWNPRWKRRKL